MTTDLPTPAPPESSKDAIAAKGLRESKERYELAILGANEGIWDWNMKTDEVFFSDRWKSIIGYEPREISNRLEEWKSRIHPDDLDRVMAAHEEHFSGVTEALTIEYRLRHKDGSYRWIFGRGACLRDGTGVPIRAAGSHTDITDRKRMEEALRGSEERFRSAFDHAPIGMALVGLDGALLQVNQALCEILGYSRDRLLNLTVHDITHPDDRELENDRKRRIRTGGSRNYQMVKRYLHADGHVVWGQLSVSLLTDARGEPLHYIGQLEDITERVRMEDELLRTRNLESLGVLAGGIAHDFNNLLTAILGNLSLAKGMTTPGDKVHERLAEAEKASLSARDLTRQLLTFSKGGAPVKSTADIGDLIRDSATFALRGSNSRCEIDAPRDLWPVEVDKGQISQVINNLVINASQAMPDGGVVEIRCENLVPTPEGDLPVQGARRVRISVKDSGIGIPREYLSKIFDPYFTTKRKGSGLGLATVHAIVRKHGGNVTVESSPGRGTTFRIDLPASEKTVPRQEEVKEALPAIGGRILVMDDEEAIRDVTGEMLGKCGFDVGYARDGDEAIEAYRKALEEGRPYKAAILDLTVPGGSGGVEAARKLLELHPKARLIVSSGYSNDPVLANPEPYGFLGVIRKPFEEAEIGKTVRDVLRR